MVVSAGERTRDYGHSASKLVNDDALTPTDGALTDGIGDGNNNLSQFRLH